MEFVVLPHVPPLSEFVPHFSVGWEAFHKALLKAAIAEHISGVFRKFRAEASRGINSLAKNGRFFGGQGKFQIILYWLGQTKIREQLFYAAVVKMASQKVGGVVVRIGDHIVKQIVYRVFFPRLNRSCRVKLRVDLPMGRLMKNQFFFQEWRICLRCLEVRNQQGHLHQRGGVVSLIGIQSHPATLLELPDINGYLGG